MLGILAGTALCLVATPVYAIQEADTVNINGVYVYRHCLETGDNLFLIDYTITYTTNPDEGANEAYIFRLMDGAVELGSTTVYAYYDDGYGRGLASIYFTAAEVTALGIVWEDPYDLQIDGNPTLHWTEATATTALDKAVADDGGVQTDETAEANSAAASDMTVLPAVPAVNDAYYYGCDSKFDLLTINIGTQGDGTWEVTWEYYNGNTTAWTALSGVTDGTAHYEAAGGNRDVEFTMPSAWDLTTVDGDNLYYIRSRVSSYTAVVTQPLGTQAWNNSITAPSTSVGAFDLWSSSTGIGATSIELGSRILYFADLFENTWSVDMIETTASGSMLTSYGEDYFTTTIENLYTMCPDIFSSGVVQPEFPLHDPPGSAYATTLRTAIVGTPLDLSDTAAIVGIDTIWLTTAIWVGIMAVAIWGVAQKVGSVKPALIVAAAMIPIGVMIGWVDLTVAIIMGFAAIVAIAYAFFLQKSSA
jgi:hypothetical protein